MQSNRTSALVVRAPSLLMIHSDPALSPCLPLGIAGLRAAGARGSSGDSSAVLLRR